MCLFLTRINWFRHPGGDIQNNYIRFQTLPLANTAPIQMVQCMPGQFYILGSLFRHISMFCLAGAENYGSREYFNICRRRNHLVMRKSGEGHPQRNSIPSLAVYQCLVDIKI